MANEIRRFKGKKGRAVIYVPAWCNGDITHRACRHGVIHEVGEIFVYVLLQGDTTVTACEPVHLVLKVGVHDGNRN